MSETHVSLFCGRIRTACLPSRVLFGVNSLSLDPSTTCLTEMARCSVILILGISALTASAFWGVVKSITSTSSVTGTSVDGRLFLANLPSGFLISRGLSRIDETTCPTWSVRCSSVTDRAVCPGSTQKFSKEPSLYASWTLLTLVSIHWGMIWLAFLISGFNTGLSSDSDVVSMTWPILRAICSVKPTVGFSDAVTGIVCWSV